MKHARSEAGNVFFLILLGVVLFAAFTVAVTRSTQQGGSANPENDKLMATNIIKYGTTLKNAVDQLRAQNISEADISFANSTVSGYGTVGANPSAEVFNFAGGGIVYEVPDAKWLDGISTAQTGYGEWRFTGTNLIAGFGSYVDASLSPASPKGHLVAILPYVKENICKEINRLLHGSATVQFTESTFDLTKFTGTYNDLDGPQIYNDAEPSYVNYKDEGCVNPESAGKYFYYRLLIAR